ncbi:ATP-binding protein [Streptomyces sp. NPDC046925]|uniref:ATP-binding protein n=1 Tax=Streptomyces sp. NPDC046925 TaxID=3155375 RepID=UPI0033C33651
MTMAPARRRHPGYDVTMTNTAESASEARRLVRTAFTAWGVEDYAEIAQVVMSELVANAVRHTRCRSIRVIVERPRPGRLLVAVVDTSQDLPCMGAPQADDLRGRGLVLVDALTHSWGTTLLGTGADRRKQVWAQLEVKPEECR